MASLVTRVAAILMMAAMMTAAGCPQSREGAIRVLAIGDPPKVRDAAVSQLSATDELLLGNVAQGLVRFDAAGNIVGGLAERWNVSDDGLSYIFRITAAKWPDGTKVTAQQVARALKRQLAVRSANSLRDAMGALKDVVAMTDRVIEVRLIAPPPQPTSAARPTAVWGFCAMAMVPARSASNPLLERTANFASRAR